MCIIRCRHQEHSQIWRFGDKEEKAKRDKAAHAEDAKSERERKANKKFIIKKSSTISAPKSD